MQFKFNYSGKNPEKFVGDKKKLLVISEDKTNKGLKIVETKTSLIAASTSNFIEWFEQLEKKGIEISKINWIDDGRNSSGSLTSFNDAKIWFLNKDKRTVINLPRSLEPNEANKVKSWLVCPDATNPKYYEIIPNLNLSNADLSQKFSQLIGFFGDEKPFAEYKDKSFTTPKLNASKETMVIAEDLSTRFNSLAAKDFTKDELENIAIDAAVKKNVLLTKINELNEKLLLSQNELTTAQVELKEAVGKKQAVGIDVDKLSDKSTRINKEINDNKESYLEWQAKVNEIASITLPHKQISLEHSQENLDVLYAALEQLENRLKIYNDELHNLTSKNQIENISEEMGLLVDEADKVREIKLILNGTYQKQIDTVNKTVAEKNELVQSAKDTLNSIGLEKQKAEMDANNSVGILDLFINLLKIFGIKFKTFNDVATEKSMSYKTAGGQLANATKDLTTAMTLKADLESKIETLRDLQSKNNLNLPVTADAKLESIQTELSNLTNYKNELFRLKNAINDSNAKINEMKSNITNQINEINDIKKDIIGLNSQQTKLQFSIEQHKFKLNTLDEIEKNLQDKKIIFQEMSQNEYVKLTTFHEIDSLVISLQDELKTANEMLPKITENAEKTMLKVKFYNPDYNALDLFEKINSNSSSNNPNPSISNQNRLKNSLQGIRQDSTNNQTDNFVDNTSQKSDGTKSTSKEELANMLEMLKEVGKKQNDLRNTEDGETSDDEDDDGFSDDGFDEDKDGGVYHHP